MSLLGKLLNKKPSAYAIAVVQYERSDFSVGHEEQLHWAIAAVVSVKNQFEIEAHTWQIMDRYYSDGRPMEWISHYRGDSQLHKTLKCLGGVSIGQIEGTDIEKLKQLIHDYAQPKPKFAGWNCRDWVMEVITNILIPNGWADARISTQASLLPSLRKAAQATAVTRQEQKRSTPYLVPLQLQ
ncbi:hypothetical protein K466DRAFT_568208 [Polyporus arcularius HHB13444]|uniref:Uncharacterized protein n=1 Tax=Polyporus arcularius HHB13444 TaxID=1314778 RepID=A0A5C3P0I4_9APHY|nr:hypothetical protein K466DRAFT_568208 [Polyporus arcularius HHB13444]